MESSKRQLIESVFAGNGEMATRMRALDWSTTPLGPVEQWPQALRTSVRIVLDSGYPMAICWGPDLRQFVQRCLHAVDRNKAPVGAGPRLSRSVSRGMGFRQNRCSTKVVTRGQAVSSLADQLVPVNRNNYLEEVYFAFSVSPIPDDNGNVGGVLANFSRRRNGCSKIDAGICYATWRRERREREPKKKCGASARRPSAKIA